MRICHIGHGRLPIPPTHWGAVEAIISDYQFHCERMGHEFHVINEKRSMGPMFMAKAFSPDVVHLHDETQIDSFGFVDAPIKIVTTHDPTFFEKPNPFIPRFVRGNFLIGALSQEQAQQFRERGVPEDRILLCPNGARADLIRFDPDPTYWDRMICLGMIGQRKRQGLLFPLDFVDCVGPISTYDPVEWKGPLNAWVLPGWSKQEVYDRLTDYSALVLISKFEADPLVVKEALMAGLTVFVSEAAAANLDRNLPFVHVLDEATINTPFALALKLRTEPIHNRQEVRRYAERTLDWPILCKRYLSSLWKILQQKHQQTVDTV